MLYFVAFLLNYSTNCLLLYISTCYISTKLPLLKIATVASIHSAGNYFLGMVLPGELSILIISLACGCVAYANKSHFVRGVIVYCLLQIVIVLLSSFLGKDQILNLVYIAVCVLAIKRVSSFKNREKMVDIEIYHKGKTVKLKALHDTGNRLIDPLSGRSVVVIGADAALLLMGLSKSQISDPVKTISSGLMPGLQLLPFKSVNESNGMMLAYKFKDVRIGEKRGSRLVAFAPAGLNDGCEYQALTGGII